MKHFGLELIKRKYSFNLKREEFALIDTKPSLPAFSNLVNKGAYTDSSHTKYREEWCTAYREVCLTNYDLNMKYFDVLNYKEFEKNFERFLAKHSYFIPVNDLNRYDNICGYYIMVLDEYKQIYIGKSVDIKRRIRQHWSKTKKFDRVLFPMYAVNTSCFSIDFFRALDTTRIYVWIHELDDGIERNLVEEIPKMYCTNRIGGDVTTAIEAIGTINKREF